MLKLKHTCTYTFHLKITRYTLLSTSHSIPKNQKKNNKRKSTIRTKRPPQSLTSHTTKLAKKILHYEDTRETTVVDVNECIILLPLHLDSSKPQATERAQKQKEPEQKEKVEQEQRRPGPTRAHRPYTAPSRRGT